MGSAFKNKIRCDKQVQKRERKNVKCLKEEDDNSMSLDLVRKFIAKSIGKEFEKTTTSIYPLQNVFIRKVTILGAPKFDRGKMMEVKMGLWLWIMHENGKKKKLAF